MDTEIRTIAAYCKKNLDLSHATLSEEYFYNSLPCCVIDAVYSIGVTYTATRNVVKRYCDYFNLRKIRADMTALPAIEAQESITDFCNAYTNRGTSFFTDTVFMNRQRTSTVRGILKAEAVYDFCRVLQNHGVNYFQDVPKALSDATFESEIKMISGQKSGISLKYFFMLAGSDDMVKPDRMIIRFLERTLERRVGLEEAQLFIQKTSEVLAQTYPSLNPRLLDHCVWNFQRNITPTKS